MHPSEATREKYNRQSDGSIEIGFAFDYGDEAVLKANRTDQGR